MRSRTRLRLDSRVTCLVSAAQRSNDAARRVRVLCRPLQSWCRACYISCSSTTPAILTVPDVVQPSRQPSPLGRR
eukprot:5069854-Prymnesium_polylepis.1